MTRFALTSTLLISCAATNCASALYLSVGSANPALAVDVTYQQTGSLSFSKVVEIANPSLVSIAILSWQTEFKLNPIGGAQGQLKFTAVAAPPSPVLANFSGPLTDLVEPSDHFLAFDVNLIDLDGSVIIAGGRCNIMELTIAASPDAIGDFELLTRAFNPLLPDLGSSWFPALELGPSPYENAVASSQAGFILLGIIHITQVYPLGDYNRDHDVTGADYLSWRETFSSTVASLGNGADGNRNGVVDAADYVLWRRQYLAASAAALAGDVPIPEPSVLVSSLAALVACSSTAFRMIRCRRDECALPNRRLAR